MRILALAKYGAEAASTRQRLLQYIPRLAEADIAVEWHSILNDDYVRRLARGAKPSRTAIAAGYGKWLAHLAGARRFDLLWVYAELFPYLPAAFERLAFAPGIPTIYDFDDAFFHQYDGHRSPAVRRLLSGKLEPLVARASACCCGNAYLAAYAARFNDRTMVLPTVVDTAAYRPSEAVQDVAVTIGWIGTPSTWTYVRPMLPLLRELVETLGVRIRIVGAGPAAQNDAFTGLEIVDWSEATEIREVQGFDIGIMPLPNEEWARGKSGYKLIQYMACALPVVASPVGVNTEIVVPDEVGYLATDMPGWRAALTRLISNAALRAKMGSEARARVTAQYSLDAQAPRLIALVRSLTR